MSDLYVDEVLSFIRAVEKLTGFKVIWKDAVGYAEYGVPDERALHINPFCDKIKARRGLVRHCVDDDCELVKNRSETGKQFFFKKCHAGVVELVIPLYRNGIFDGALFCGPTRLHEDRCPYLFCRKEFLTLPVFNRKLFASAKSVFRLLAQYIHERKDAWELEQLAMNIGSSKVRQAVNFIKNNISNELSVSIVAEQCELSESRFIHVFKEQTSMTFSEYLVKEKIGRAKRLLESSNLKISDVSFAAGFTKQSYFGMVFKKQTGMTPTQYRKYRKIGVMP
jgi:AraC-like DNA-binding protein